MARDYQGKWYQRLQGSAPVGRTATGSGIWWGLTGIASRTVEVAATAVAATSIIHVTLASAVNSVPSAPPLFLVHSINPGVGFSLMTVASLNPVSSYTAMWSIVNHA